MGHLEYTAYTIANVQEGSFLHASRAELGVNNERKCPALQPSLKWIIPVMLLTAML